MPGLFIDVPYGAFKLLVAQTVLDERVVFAIDFHRTQGDDFAASRVDNANVFALKDAGKDCAEPLARLSGGHCLHTLIIMSPAREGKPPLTNLELTTPQFVHRLGRWRELRA